MSSDSSGPRPRSTQRVPLTAEVSLRRAGINSFRVRVFDASPQGCKIEFIEIPALGERLWVRFDGLQAVAATVRWVEGHIGGVHFEKPLHDAVFKQLVA